MKRSLFSLIPPSYMVAPNRELANKPSFNSPTSSFSSSTNNLSAVNLSNNTGIDIRKEKSSDNYDKVRGVVAITRLICPMISLTSKAQSGL